MIANAAVRDERLTFKARGILAYLLSHNDGWDISIRRLAESGPDGRAAVETGVQELVQAGYLIIDEQDRSDAGKFGGNSWQVVDTIAPKVADYPVADNPVADNPVADNPATKKNILKKNIQKEEQVTPIGVTARVEVDRFEEFWAVYPRRAGKAAARAAWDKATKRALPGAIIAAAIGYRDDPNREEKFTAHPSTWLNQDRWEDDPLPSRAPVARKQLSRVEQNLAEYNRLYGDTKNEPARSLPAPHPGVGTGWANGYGSVGRSVG